MKEKINPFDYAERFSKALPEGILLNTAGEKFNSMVIGWGHLGVIWNLPSFTVYVRQSRYTKPQLDRTREFTISAPLAGRLTPEVFRVCGVQSGREVDKEKAASLTLVAAETIRVLYQQDQTMEAIPDEVRQRFYAGGSDARDFHTAYNGQILSAYIIRED